jgi:hypothetical protein
MFQQYISAFILALSDATAFASYQDLISLSGPWMDVGCHQAKTQEASLLLAQHL